MKRKITAIVLTAALLGMCFAVFTACGKTVSDISVDGDDFYIVNEELGDVKLSVVYDDGSKDEVSVTSDMISGFDTSVEGKHTASITYGGITTTYSYEVSELYVKSIAMQEGYESAYVVGDSFKGATIVATYTDKSTKTVPVDADMLGGFDTSTVGDKTVAVRYERKTCTFEIHVREAAVTGIKINGETQTDYAVNEPFAGIGIDVTYENNRTDTVWLNDLGESITGFDTSLGGEKSVTVTYGGQTTSLSINVIKQLVDIGLAAEYEYRMYAENESYTDGDVKLSLIYDDGTTEEKDVTSDMIAGFDTSSPGRRSVKVTYGDFSADLVVAVPLVTASDSYKIQVEEGQDTTPPTEEELAAGVSGKAGLFVDLSEAKLMPGVAVGNGMFENTTNPGPKPNGAEGYSICNVAAKGNKIIVRFSSSVAGTFSFSARCQSIVGRGGTDMPFSRACKLTVNGNEVVCDGVVGKASSSGGGWNNLDQWTDLTIAEDQELKVGENVVVIECLFDAEEDAADGGRGRFPNFDYFTVVATAAD